MAVNPQAPGSPYRQRWRAAGRRPHAAIVDRQLVSAALRTLSAEHREVQLETYYRGASIADAAQTLGVRFGTIKSRAHSALHALRRALDEMADSRHDNPPLGHSFLDLLSPQSDKSKICLVTPKGPARQR